MKGGFPMSDITTAMLSPALSNVVDLIPVVIPVMVGFVAIRKGISFVYRVVRGA